MRLAALIIVTAGGSTAAQNCWFTVSPTTEPGLFAVSARFFNAPLPGDTTRVASIWSDVGFSIEPTFASSGMPITFESFNPAFRSDLFGDPQISDRSSTPTTFRGFQAPEPIGGNPDPSDPLHVATFRYGGAFLDLRFALVGQNAALFAGDPAMPFGTVELYLDAQGSAGDLSFNADLFFGTVDTADLADFIVIPTPGTLALAPLALVVARRRRR